MNLRMVPIFAAASAISLAAAGCSNNNDAAAGMSDSASDMTAMPASADMPMPSDAAMGSDTAMGADSHAAKFIMDGMKGDNSEVKLGQLAADQGSSAAVRSFGKMLVADHGKHATELAALGGTMGVSKTDAVMPAADETYAMLKGLTGGAFDKAFAMHMVQNHKTDIAMYQAEADSKDPAALVDNARKTLPVLKKHLAAAQALPK